MARPRKQTVDYFPHVVSHKKTMYILEQRYGNDGYAFWFKLLEMLGASPGHYVDFNDDTQWEFLQAKTRLSQDICTGILNLLAKLQAIDRVLWMGNRVVWCQNFVDGVADVYKNRRLSIPERPSFYNQKPPNTEVSKTDNLPLPPIPPIPLKKSKVKETKVKETKVKETKEVSSISNKTTLEDVLDAFRKNILLDDQVTIPEYLENDIRAAVKQLTDNRTHDPQVSAEWAIDAIKLAASRDKKDWNYIAAILKNWCRWGKVEKRPRQSQKRMSPEEREAYFNSPERQAENERSLRALEARKKVQR